MTLETARRRVHSQLLAAGLTEAEASAALAALIVAGPLAESRPDWIPPAFASRASYPARDIVAEMLRIRGGNRPSSSGNPTGDAPRHGSPRPSV